VVAVEVRQEDDVDRAGIHTDTLHVRQQRRSTIEQEPSIHHHRAVVPVGGESRSCPEEGQLQAMVTVGFRYTS
jgi:hypothetical protein